MTIRKKTTIIFFSAFLCLTITVAGLKHFLIDRDFDRLEQDLLADTAGRVRGLFEEEQARFATLVVDNATWDDAWEFSRGQRPDFHDKHMTPASLRNLGVHAAAFHAPSGELTAGAAHDPATEAMSPLPEPLRALGRQAALDLQEVPRLHLAGFLSLSGTPYLLAAAPVRRSDGSGPPSGVLVFFRRLDEVDLARLSRLARLPLSLVARDSGDWPPELDSADGVAVQALSDDEATAWAPLPGVLGESSLILRLRAPRAVSRQGRLASGTFLGWLACSALTLSGLAILLTDRLALLRLSRLSAQAASIAGSGDSTARLGPQGQDEIGRLAESLDAMLASLDQANNELERRVAERTAELAQANDQLRRQAEELRQGQLAAERTAQAKSDFLATMSHEIRTPMSGVIGMLDLALGQDASAETKDCLRLARTSAGALLAIVNDILDFSRIESGRLTLVHKPFHLPALLDSVTAPLAVAARDKGLELSAVADEGTPAWLTGDEGRLRQVLLNVAGNAVKFTERGQVELRVGPCPDAAPREGRAVLLFTIRDTGVGIAADKLETIFESFAQLGEGSRAQVGGTGLGLAISRRLTTLMGGSIAVTSQADQGSVFLVRVPLALAQDQTQDQAQAGTQPDETGDALPSPHDGAAPLRLLVVEDNLISQTLVRGLLERRGHQVVVAANGREALDILASARFDAVFMDARMPVLGGEETVRLIRHAPPPGVDPELPIIALTAHALPEDRDRFLAAGMDEYLTKPMDPADLERVLAQVVTARRRGR